MSGERELEQRLQRGWNPTDAAVYADALAERGDPRGELIALDLECERTTEATRYAELQARKRDVLAHWLGDSTDGWRPRPHHFKRGVFCDAAFPVEKFAAIPIGELAVYGDKAEVAVNLRAMAAGSLPWLHTLQIERVGGKQPIDDELWAAVIEATPHLRDLTVIGTRVVRSPIHRSLTALRLVGVDGVVIGAHPIANVTCVQLTAGTADPTALAALVNPRTFPALRELDLSSLALSEAEAVLAAIEDPPRIRRARMPEVATTGDLERLRRWCDRFPECAIEIARIHSALEPHPPLSVPAPRVWPAARSLHGRSAVSVEWSSPPEGDDLSLHAIAEHLEEQFDDMHPVARDAWEAFWKFERALPYEDDRGGEPAVPFSATLLRCAVEALREPRCGALADRLHRHPPPGDRVMIRRYWGW